MDEYSRDEPERYPRWQLVLIGTAIVLCAVLSIVCDPAAWRGARMLME